jgi:endonuclease/exonuclease/phosphatase family metal-dependent hydrolase
MPLKLLSLNVENDRHLERVMAAIDTHLPDIVCLQEVFEKDCARLAAVGDYQVKYAISALMPEGSKGNTSPRSWGVAVLTRVPVARQTLSYYSDDPRIRIFKQPNDPRRLVLTTEIDHEGRFYRIGTTHFTWSKNGEANHEQREDFARLKQLLLPYPHYVLCGDFNSPRGREMFSRFTGELGLADHLPADIKSTLDPKFHRVPTLELAVDTIFSTPEYRLTQVQVLEGLSDHKGILARVERIAIN